MAHLYGVLVYLYKIGQPVKKKRVKSSPTDFQLLTAIPFVNGPARFKVTEIIADTKLEWHPFTKSPPGIRAVEKRTPL